MNWLLFVLAAFLVSSVLIYISRIGKPREPVTPGDAVTVVIIYSVIVFALIAAGWRMTR